MLALLSEGDHDLAMMTIWLTLALVIDGIDVPLSRRYAVTENAPIIDGVMIDLIVYYLTAVMIQSYAINEKGLLPGWSGWIVVLLIPFASALYFADTRMKTEDKSFRGFPGCWNMVALAMLVIVPAWEVILGLVVALSVAQFLNLKFVHPVRTARWRWVTLPVALIWTGSIALAALTDFSPNPILTGIVTASSLYLLLVGIIQQLVPARA